MKGTPILLLFICTIFLSAETNAAKKVVCYFESWAYGRQNNGAFDVEQIDPFLCTHINYAFAGITPDAKILVSQPQNDITLNGGRGAYNRFVNLRLKNPALKVLIAVGGWTDATNQFSQISATPATRNVFVQSASEFVRNYRFDGMDLDWEYPAQNGGSPADVQNFNLLLQALRTEFNKYGLLLSAAVAATKSSASKSYDIPTMARYLDYINVMTYDFHGDWEGVTGQNAPLYASSHDVNRELNVKASIDYWVSTGIDPSKLILGLASYGRSFTLINPSNTGLGSPAYAGAAGPCTASAGILGYNEIVTYQKAGGWTVIRDNEQKVPYMYKQNQWIGYDDPTSITYKLQNVYPSILGGAMLWALDMDDFRGISGTTFPILKTINNVLKNNIVSPIPTSRPTTAAPPPQTGVCSREGYVRDPMICSKFYYCMLVNGRYTAYEMNCAGGLYFDATILGCNWPWLVKC